ncbi:ISKra4 family transposase [Glaciimonas sp. Gout2]|uniref:ISKra4 family transposase n=1 Tax=unclassified Glaciimonas TaxID=2644401 RepID=UPI002B232E8D|nr:MULTISPECIES: ISKra4 family transposase [unclassified Glaciimonas]MEB0013945.1 ISKra4 family transposase [Glaciimonas sp. Cout2]MEB0083149.1 ISKra4 family transposase [Glaciimonas sp. Gout2]
MRMIIEARIDGGGEAIRLAEVERLDGDLKQLGLNLAEGRSLVHEAQRALVSAQTRFVVSASLNCPQCGRALSIKATHAIRYRTVFGKVTIDSPQLRVCRCVQEESAKSFSPLALAMPLRVSSELEYLQVKWAAHLPYAVATTLMKEILPLDQTISTSELRNRVWAVGQELDDHAESAIHGERDYPLADPHVKIVALAVDSAWLRHRPSRKEKDEATLAQYFPSKRPPPTGRHVNIIAGRAVRDDGSCKVYGYVNREVTSAASRLDHFLSEQGVANDQKITIISDGAGEFEKAVDGSRRPLNRILDWFHIAMKFRAIEHASWKFPHLLAPNGRSVQDEIASAKWLTWHGKGSEAVQRIKSIHDMLEVTPEHPAYSTLWWNLRGTYWYLESNGQYLVNYGWRYRRVMPISSSIAESAVNEVVSLRSAKKRQMRWTNKGAHLLVQVRIAVLNGELKMREMPEPRRFTSEEKSSVRFERFA